MLKVRLNHQINVPEVRVINEEGQQIGVMKTSEALKLATDNGLDLVEVAPMAKPPVCKVIDFAKYKYQQKKAEALQKKNSQKTEVKTIWISVRISEHDMQVKAKKIDEFLNDGDLVKIELRMRGREQAYAHLGKEHLDTFLKFISVPFRIEIPIKKMGGTFSLLIAPSK